MINIDTIYTEIKIYLEPTERKRLRLYIFLIGISNFWIFLFDLNNEQKFKVYFEEGIKIMPTFRFFGLRNLIYGASGEKTLIKFDENAYLVKATRLANIKIFINELQYENLLDKFKKAKSLKKTYANSK